MKKQQILLLISLLGILVSAQAQKASANPKSMKMSNGIDTVVLFQNDKLPYSFFNTGKVRSFEDPLCTSYVLLIEYYKNGNKQFVVTNHFLWSDSIIQTLYQTKPDSLILNKSVYIKDKHNFGQFHIKLVY